MKTTATFESFEILCTTSKGASLVATNEGKAAWLRPFQVRENGTITPSGIEVLNAATMTTEEAKAKYGETIRRSNMTEEERKADFRARQNAPVSVYVSKENFKDAGEKAFKVKTRNMFTLYGKLVNKWDFLPKSMVSVEETETMFSLTMPKWLLDKNSSMLFVEM